MVFPSLRAPNSLADVACELVQPSRVWSRAEVLANGECPVPRLPGIYAWYFRDIPTVVPRDGCCVFRDLTLLYIGISPTAPPLNGKPPSERTLYERIRTHYRRNAKGSTLRFTLGCLLAGTLGIQLRRVGSGNIMTFAGGEELLSKWLAQNAFVVWAVHPHPWEVEKSLIQQLSVPLNLNHNQAHPFHAALKAIRRNARAEARRLPVVLRMLETAEEQEPVPMLSTATSKSVT